MRVLVCDTSNSSCSAGVYEINNLDVKELSYRLSLEKRTHSEVILPLISEVMNESKTNQNDVDYYAVTVGPGSFTGIRIGVSTIKGMAVVTDKDTVAISSTEALARSVEAVFDNGKTYILSCFDARNKRVFGAVYDKEINPVVPENAYAIEDIMNKLFEVLDAGSMVLVCGNGADAISTYISGLEDTKGIDFDYAGGAVILPKGIAITAANMINRGEIVSALKLAPKYCAKSQAERFKKPIEVQVREAQLSEASTINVLEAEGIDHPWTFEAVKALINDDNKVALVAVDKLTNEVLGYIGASWVIDEAEVGNLCVFGKYRRIGVATKIMDAFISFMKEKGVKTIFLEVNHDNYKAISLYEKCGFVLYGTRKDYYGQGKDADLYKIEL
ncbi:MAG: tRNA (adenosine(37)-N6)-threonylcarbamoyltransferase complex dimerization subunit type 1 TsaB [Clostridia bacterium]|nr:tRNA (adenosine(37)-N6)-threonylcarbamoyltransferase complex dimerization subunit type 1 TsaB [Clostridia bacterium]